ncbi:MAG: hypothetical protein ACTHNZ_22600, partial [Trinickia sp.]|uniref:hypothetical protein n=1 Tax=Trinickia sp. TaxID=2571163 RepID=UPI003F81D1B0
LIESWFFVDPVLAKPARLQALIRDLGPIPAGTMAPENIWLAVTSLWDRALLPILLVAMLFAILRPSRRVFMCWGLGAAAILAMGVIGRPAIMRVYIPLVSMLVVAPFLVKGSKQAFSHFSRSTLLVVLFLMTLNSFFLISDFEEIKQNSEDVTEALARLPERAVVIWGAALPYQFAYSVFHMPHALMDLKIYGLGVITLAPVSTAYADEKAGRGLLTMLSEKEGVPLISVPGQIDLLRGYCAEHLQGNFQVLSALHFKFFDFGRYRCEHRTP